MDGYKYATVVNSSGEYQTRVLILLIEDSETGIVSEKIQHYQLKDGETLIDEYPPLMRPYAMADGFITPRWNFEKSIWEETATESEISDWENVHPEPEPEPEPTAEEILLGIAADHEERLCMMEIGI